MEREHNDYEIIDRIRQGDEDAFALLVANYSRLISKKIHKFNLAYEYDDLYQECLIIIHRSVCSFNEHFRKTFTRYLEMNIERHLISFIEKRKRRSRITAQYLNDIAENNHCLGERNVYYSLHLGEIQRLLSPVEYAVYVGRELKRLDFKTIARKNNLGTKGAYNALHRAKAKIKAYFED